MKKFMKLGALMFLALSVAFGTSLAYAQSQESEAGKTPAGWTKGEKKGWHDESVPPGLAKKEAKKAEEAKSTLETEKEKAEKKAKKEKAEQEKKAKREKEKAEKKAKKEKEELEKQTSEKMKNTKKEAEGQKPQKAVEKQKKHPKFWPFGKKKAE